MSPVSRVTFALAILLAVVAPCSNTSAQDDATLVIRQRGQQLVTAFNSGKVSEVAALFMPGGELIDESGTIYEGTQEITGLLNAFFQEFPGTKLSLDVESIRLVGPVAIDEGTRTMSTADGKLQSQCQYIAIWANVDKVWKLASFRDFETDANLTSHDNLKSIAWLVGDWVNEGSDGTVTITYRWSDDGNHLLGDFNVLPIEGPARKSTQRIAWDPATSSIRSWLFDADGGFSEGVWTVIDDEIIAKSQSTNPDGSTASATLTITSIDGDHYTIAGSDRIVAGNREPDFELTVTKRPPQPGK
jgi:uncharacterized protein (TIGR02246 family)